MNKLLGIISAGLLYASTAFAYTPSPNTNLGERYVPSGDRIEFVLDKVYRIPGFIDIWKDTPVNRYDRIGGSEDCDDIKRDVKGFSCHRIEKKDVCTKEEFVEESCNEKNLSQASGCFNSKKRVKKCVSYDTHTDYFTTLSVNWDDINNVHTGDGFFDSDNLIFYANGRKIELDYESEARAVKAAQGLVDFLYLRSAIAHDTRAWPELERQQRVLQEYQQALGALSTREREVHDLVGHLDKTDESGYHNVWTGAYANQGHHSVEKMLFILMNVDETMRKEALHVLEQRAKVMTQSERGNLLDIIPKLQALVSER